jgi:hypothetical protein
MNDNDERWRTSFAVLAIGLMLFTLSMAAPRSARADGSAALAMAGAATTKE